MKKFFALALAIAAVGSMSAQKQAVDQARKIAKDNPAQARELIKGAMADPTTKDDVKTYYWAGKIEFDSYDNDFKTLMTNPNAPIDQVQSGQQLLRGFEYFLKAFPLDSLPNAKGKVDPKFSKDMASKIAGHATDFFTAGATAFNAQKYYPEAYKAFVTYGDLPSYTQLGAMAPQIPDSVRATAYFNAGLSAYSGNAVPESAAAFKKARLCGYDKPEAYTYEIACWQNVVLRDSTQAEVAQKAINEIATAGYKKFGLSEPLFINNLINGLVLENKIDEAVAIIDKEVAANPDNAMGYGLMGFVYDRAGNNEKSIEAYRKAASLPNVDFETLKNSMKKIFRSGTEKWNLITGNTAESNAARQDVRVNYFEAAKAIGEKAKALNPTDKDLLYILDSIQYALDSYF